ncbi:u3 small nucleolar RNA-associated protein 11 [Pisolithus marmoratus]|nr:u3 small nucleolar RNA-associated protein 11 [Pisolithus marmoratus]
MTSSLRNSLHRRSHKERGQLAHRARFGLLEKHKDYVLRARDYHAKQDRLNRLRRKAADKNKDEFYFAMNKERTAEGVHIQDRGNKSMPMDMVKLLKTQDEGYVRTMRAAGLKKIEKLKNQLTSLANLVSFSDEGLDVGDEPLNESELETLCAAGVLPPQPESKGKQKHNSSPRLVLFAEDETDAQRYLDRHRSNGKTENSSPSDEPVDLGWKDTTSTKARRRRARSEDTKGAVGDLDAEEAENIKHRKRLLKELAARLNRDTQLLYAQRELEMQRQLAGKGGRRKVRGVEEIGANDEDDDEDDGLRTAARQSTPKTYKPRIYKWRVERKR